MRTQPWYVPRRLRSQIMLVVGVGLILAQILTGTIWSQMRKQVLVETPARVAAARFADWWSYAEHQLQRGRTISPRLLKGIEAQPLTAGVPEAYDSYLSDNLNQLFQDVVSYRADQTAHFYLSGVTKHKPDKGARAYWWGVWRDDIALESIEFTGVLRLSNGELWQLTTRENQGQSSISTLDLIYDYMVRIYLLRLLLVVGALWVCLRVILRPLDKLEASVSAIRSEAVLQPVPVIGAQEFRQLACAFNQMLERLTHSIQERTHFFTAISHDLRTPLTRLRLRSQTIQEPELKEKIQHDLDQLQDLVQATLELMTVRHTAEARQKTNMLSLVQTVVLNRQDVEDPVQLCDLADGNCCIQVQAVTRCLENLLSNALRYGQRAYVSTQQHQACFQIYIADNGPGIPAEEQERVLEPYYRLESSRNLATGGYGLGLSICQEIMCAQEGRLYFTQWQNRFCVCLEFPLSGA